MCLTGESVAEVINRIGGKVSNKLGNKLIDKVPGKVLQQINGKMGGRIFTKFGTTGIVNLVDLIPVLGGVVGGGINYFTTKKIGEVSIQTFI